ncbi:hypothetical protein J1614_011437 [Plenodomus biglobosus]|nr:hypothetical protein J1614_011437 [Plenodomus biglobosus]
MILFLYETQIEPREAQDDLGHTPLALAAAEGNETTVSALISLKANTRVSRNDGFIPWQIALQNGHMAVARMFPEWMLSYGESQDPKTEPELGRLAAAGDRPALSMAIASRAQGRLRRNPLMPVVIANREEIVREVLSQEVDGDVGLACVRTALVCAAARGKETLVARVLDAGNNGRMTRNEGMYRELSEIADYLVAYMQQD